jgi:RNA polymerase sigma factor (sigma-70 family)
MMIKVVNSWKIDETLDSAMRSGFKRIRSWQVPPNWSRTDWIEELAAVATAAVWQAVCEFDPKRGVPLAGFAYCRMTSRCLACYRKEWRYALHIDAKDSCKEQTRSFNGPAFAATPAAKTNGSRCSENLRGAVAALPAEQRRLLEQLFWEERTEVEVANTMSINQSTINRRKQGILKSLRMKLSDSNEFQRFCIILFASNLTSWLAGLGEGVLGT